MNARARRLVLFAREPVPGRVKTRLARAVGPAAAASLYEAFLSDLAVALAPQGNWDAVLAYAEPEPGPVLFALFAARWTLVPQGEGSLGDRLRRAVARARAAGPCDVLVAGSDAPTLHVADASAAFQALAQAADVVFAPALDGGFSLVGVREGVEPLDVFPTGARWSSAQALLDCRMSAVRGGLRVELLSTVPDVDEIGDLANVEALLAGDPGLAPATRRALLAWTSGNSR